MIKRIYEMIAGKEIEIKERFFRILLALGTVVFALAVLEEAVLHGFSWLMVALLVSLAIMLYSGYLTFMAEKTDIATILLGILLIFFLLPLVFLGYGGVGGGAEIWLVLGMAYVTLMFHGKRLIVFAILAIGVDIALYSATYFYPEFAEKLVVHENTFFDTMFSMLLVGITISAILKFQINMYDKEWKKVKKRTKELELLGRSKDTFFANMSHEIRTPINTIIGLNEMILREGASEEIMENAIDIQNASVMLLELVNDILDMSKIEMGKMEIIPADYDTRLLLERIVKLVKVNARKKNLEFLVHIDESLPKTLHGDEKRISQVLLNILSNAVKYTKNGSVTLEVHNEWLAADRIRLRMTIADTGIGIKKEDMSGLFDSFQRVDAANTHKVEGTGLGLAITKQLTDMMGGEITVDSIYTKGSTFTVTLEQKVIDSTPIENAATLIQNVAVERQQYRQLFEAPEAQILLVDDNEMNASVVAKLLRATRVQVDVARSGKECLEAAAKKYYHVILMDYMMPEMSGLETLRALRKQENSLCRETPVLALTGNVLPGGEQTYISYGFHGYLEKPVNGLLLEERILELLPLDVVEYRQTESEVQSDSGRFTVKRKRRKICITSDCVCDIPEALREQYDIQLMYLYVKTSHGRFRDTKELDSENLARQMNTCSSDIYADSASVEEYENFFAEVLTDAEAVIHISMGGQMGSSYDKAVKAAQSFGHVHVINSGHISGGQGLLVLHAAKMAKDGYGIQEIYRELGKVKPRISASFLLPSIRIFRERGYVNSFVSKLCELLSLHPCMKIKQDHLAIRMAWFGKIDTAIRQYVRLQFWRKWRVDRRIVYVTHAGCSVKQQEELLREIKRLMPFEQVILEQSSVSSSCNSGMGTIGIAYFLKK